MIRLILMLCMFITPAFAANTSSDALEQAKQAMVAERYAQALETLQGLVKKEPKNYEAWFLFGVAQVHEQKDQQAIEAFRHVIELRPKLAEPHNNLAAVYNNLGDTKAAIRELETALEKRPNYLVAEENLADLHIKMALQYYRNSLSHGAPEAIEQRYARLLQVRNPAQQPIKQIAQPSTQQPTPKSRAKTNTPQEKTPAPVSNTPSPSTSSVPIETAALAVPVPVVVPAAAPIVASAPASNPADENNAEMHNEASNMAAPSMAKDVSITSVLDALEAWRKAWSAQDLDLYFSAYDNHFNPGSSFESIQAWKAYKMRVIQNKSFIDVQFDKVEVNIPATRDVATIEVRQHFRSDTYVGNDHKRITMKYTSTGWKIISEVTIP